MSETAENKDFTVTLGGLAIENYKGEMAYIAPAAQYQGVSPEGLLKLERHLMANEALQEANQKLAGLIQEAMLSFGEILQEQPKETRRR